jgi:hypothetical protein
MKDETIEKKNRSKIFDKLVGTSVLLLVALSSVAGANPTSLGVTTSPAQPIVGQPFSITIMVQDPEPSSCANFMVDFDSLSPSVDLSPTGTGVIGTATISNVVVNSAGPHTINVHVEGPETNLHFNVHKDINVINPTSVPEFPSVAIPVAAILGLVVIFGRRKNMRLFIIFWSSKFLLSSCKTIKF